MSVTKTPLVAQASATNSAGGTTTGSWVNVTGAYKASILVRVANGSTGPTAPCVARVDLSPDGGTTIYTGAGGAYIAGVQASGVFAAMFDLPEDAMYARVVFAGNTGQAVTVQADVTAVTAL